MGPYNRSPTELVWRQINRDNPQLPIPLSADNVVLLQGPLTTNLGDSGRNTRAIFNAVLGKGYEGKVEVFYDRINLSYLYNNQSPKVTIPYRATTREQMLPYINEKLGLSLVPEDILNPTAVAAASSVGSGTVAIQPSATCMAFVGGAFTVSFVREPPSLADAYNPSLDSFANIWDNWGHASAIHKRSFEQWSTVFSAVPRDTPLTSTTATQNFVAMLRNVTGIGFVMSASLTSNPQEFEIFGATLTLKSTAVVPDANPMYRNVYVLTPVPGRHRWTRPLYFHVTPRFTEAAGVGQDVLDNYIAGNGSAFKYLPPTYSLQNWHNRTLTTNLGLVDGAYTMVGTPWGGNGAKITASNFSRILQHAYPDKATFDYAIANKLNIVCQTTNLFSVSQYPSLNRNGYQSNLAGGGDEAVSISKLIYFDPVAGIVKYSNPYGGTAGQMWIP